MLPLETIPAKNLKIKPAQENPPWTIQSYPEMGPGFGGASRSLSCSQPSGVGGQRGGDLSLGRAVGLEVCSCRFLPIANCCHSQEEGGGQGLMTQVSLGWYSLQGLLVSW